MSPLVDGSEYVPSMVKWNRSDTSLNRAVTGTLDFPVGHPVDEPPDLVEQFVPAVLEDRRHGVGDVCRLFPPLFAALGIELFVKQDGVGDDGVFPLGIVRVGEPGVAPQDRLAFDGQLHVAAPRKVRGQGDDLRQRVEIEVLSSLGLGDPLAELRRAELDGENLGGVMPSSFCFR